MTNLTIFTATDQRNIDFIIPFTYFALYTNPNAFVEVHYINSNYNVSAFNKLQILFQDRFLYKYVNTHIPMNKYRYLITPTYMCDYTYIPDIDILICEDIANFHLQRMTSEYVYDNEIRLTDTSRFSGLHFVHKDWYKFTHVIRQKYITSISHLSDEQLLLDIAKKSNIKLRPLVKNVNEFNKCRPVHGQHISLSRLPFSPNSSMKNIIDPKYKTKFFEILNSSEFNDIISTCTGFKHILNNYLTYCRQ